MAKLTIDKTPGVFSFVCPGCGDIHHIHTQVHNGQGTVWGFNGDLDKPTFTPSLLMTQGHYVPGQKPDAACWCTYNEIQKEKGAKPAPFECYRCHSYVRDGIIIFLSDCSHALAGKSVPLPDIDHE